MADCQTSERRRVALQEITSKIGSGATPRGGKESYKADGIPLIRSLNVYDFCFEKDDLAFIDDEQAQQLANVKVERGDILLNITGASVARCCMAPNDLVPARVNQHVAIVRTVKTVADPRFVLYTINSPQYKQHLLSLAQGGATREALTKETLEKFEIGLPALRLQRRIASVLSAYDDLIENNTRRIRTLKEIAKTIFSGASKSHPEAWSVLPIGEVYEGLFDGPHATPKPSASGPIFLGIKNVTEHGELDLTDIRHIAEDDFPQWTRRVLPQSGDIVFTYEATLNRYAVINRDLRGCLGRRLALIRPDQNRIDAYLLLRCLLSDEWRKEVQSKIIAGATVDRIPLVTFPTFLIRVPNPELQARIGPPIRACEELAENCRRRNDLLRNTRDLLLPKLISGEIPVEAAGEAAAELMDYEEEPA
jgi:type I restriction enzyme, S subunit